MPVEVSGIVALQFGGESGEVGATPVDLAPAYNSADPVAAPLFVPMPQKGAVRGISVKLETGVGASPKAADVAATIAGVEGNAKITLAAAATEGYARFDKDVMPFVEGNELGVSVTGSEAAAIAAQEILVTLFVQLGKSEI